MSNIGSRYLTNLTIGTPPQPLTVRISTAGTDFRIPLYSAPDRTGQSRHTYSLNDSSSAFRIPTDTYKHTDVYGSCKEYISDTINMGGTELKSTVMELATDKDHTMGVMGLGYSPTDVSGQDQATTGILNQMRDQGLIAAAAYSLWYDEPGTCNTHVKTSQP